MVERREKGISEHVFNSPERGCESNNSMRCELVRGDCLGGGVRNKQEGGGVQVMIDINILNL